MIRNGESMSTQYAPKTGLKPLTIQMIISLTCVVTVALYGCGEETGERESNMTAVDPDEGIGRMPDSESLDASESGHIDASNRMDMGSEVDQGSDTDIGVDTDSGVNVDIDADIPDLGSNDASVTDDAPYIPDDGPTHENGRIVSVGSAGEILDAIADASPGDVITIREGSYDFSQLIRVQNDGRADDRIFLRSERRDAVTLNLSHIENFKIYAKFWVFENIRFVGVCDDDRGCEHAFHIVGDADDLIFRHNEIVNFASHVKLNAEVMGEGPAKSFPDRTMFIDNFWHNTRYIPNDAPHNILNLDGGRGHVVRGNIFADFNTPESLPKSASAVYPKASTLGILIEQNLIVCEKERTAGETTRGIQLGDGAPASICDGDVDQDGLGDCVENGQNQEAIVRNNIIMNCNNGGSAAGIMVGSDRASMISHNTVYNVGQRNGGFYIGHPDHDTFWRSNIMENGFNTNYAERALNQANHSTPSLDQMNSIFASPIDGDFSLVQDMDITEQGPTDDDVPHDFCGTPRGARADRGAIEYSTTDVETPCATRVREMYDRIP